ncbi:hypothetical protein [Nocardioides sp. ChNu-99]|uniref:hypothetical protein n=1 Tax=Nocardioides sp. ChNu-99 TaxID=2839897 RepID=UPI0024052960|nr:hypothetical protein [Nocardioides sp. ChNu-99]MDF9716487.1 HNH endonuclease [Nocardioides sp. ChNu-99]
MSDVDAEDTFLRAVLGQPGVRQRFWSKVVLVPGSSCAWWVGAIADGGHGRFWLGSSARRRDVVAIAHRVAYAFAYGPEALDQAALLTHSCDNPLCQNVEHLRPGTEFSNAWEWSVRRHRTGGPLRDVRGATGRARAARAVILGGGSLAEVLQAGDPDQDQGALF